MVAFAPTCLRLKGQMYFLFWPIIFLLWLFVFGIPSKTPNSIGLAVPDPCCGKNRGRLEKKKKRDLHHLHKMPDKEIIDMKQTPLFLHWKKGFPFLFIISLKRDPQQRSHLLYHPPC